MIRPIFLLLRKPVTQGATDYLVLVHRFAAEGVIGEMDCVYSSWSSDAPDGFGEDGVVALKRLAPFLKLALKSAALARIAGTLAQTYLGRDPGRRVMSGRIVRGVAEKIGAVLWYSDLHGYTQISDNSPPEQIIPLLNDYAEVVVSAVHGHGGDVLKLVGDGTLAIFPADNREEACRGALAAAVRVRKGVIKLNGKRAATGLPTSQVYLALHVGDVFYGNIGSKDRLDFTIIGPAVNEVSRILAMSRSVEQDVLLSADFADAVGSEMRRRLVSVGRYALRGVAQPLELFTPEPDFEIPQPRRGKELRVPHGRPVPAVVYDRPAGAVRSLRGRSLAGGGEDRNAAQSRRDLPGQDVRPADRGDPGARPAAHRPICSSGWSRGTGARSARRSAW